MSQQGLTTLTNQAEAATLDQGPVGTTSTHSKQRQGKQHVGAQHSPKTVSRVIFSPSHLRGKAPVQHYLLVHTWHQGNITFILHPTAGQLNVQQLYVCPCSHLVLMQCKCSLWLLRHISSCSSKQITSFSALILSLSKICCLNFWSPLPLGRNQAQCDSQIFRAVSVKLQ